LDYLIIGVSFKIYNKLCLCSRRSHLSCVRGYHCHLICILRSKVTKVHRTIRLIPLSVLDMTNFWETFYNFVRFRKRSQIMWKIYALLSALFAALTAIFAKVGVRDVNPDLATAIRTTVILLLTWGIVLFGRQAQGIREISGHTWIFLVLSGLATGLSWLFYFKAMQTGDVSRVAPIDKLSVVITIFLACLFLKEPVSTKVILGALLITAGSIVMLIK